LPVATTMGSALVCMDFSERERRDALNFIDLFRDKTTRDELGLGTIRDALADRLFPGTSTVQTRARHFPFIPWIYQDLERRGPLLAMLREWRETRRFAY
jgi:hypothetical protein